MGVKPLIERAPPDGAVMADSLTTPDAFAAIFDRHYTGVHRYLARRVGRQLADDLASLTFTVAFERRRSFRTDSASALPWLLGIATNLLRDHRRAELRGLETVARLGQRLPDAQAGLGTNGAAPPGTDPELAAALAHLDADQRDVLLLYAWGELSYEEIAETLAIPLGTVRSRLSRARAQVRSDLSASQRSTE